MSWPSPGARHGRNHYRSIDRPAADPTRVERTFAEKMALERGRTLLVLDTAVEDGASRLYEGLGFNLTGVIPDYSLKPHGGLTGTMIYWKRIAAETA